MHSSETDTVFCAVFVRPPVRPYPVNDPSTDRG